MINCILYLFNGKTHNTETYVKPRTLRVPYLLRQIMNPKSLVWKVQRIPPFFGSSYFIRSFLTEEKLVRVQYDSKRYLCSPKSLKILYESDFPTISNLKISIIPLPGLIRSPFNSLPNI